MTIQEMQERKIELGYSNAMLAEKSGVPVSTVQKVLGGFTRAPRKATLRALEAALREDSKIQESYGPYTPKRADAQKDLRALHDHARGELIDGQIYRLPPPSLLHQEILVRVLVPLANHLAATQNPGKIVPSPFGVCLGTDDSPDYLEPDLMVISRPECLTEAGCTGAPDWVLEVTSPETKFRDLTVKTFKYRSAGVRECWIADPEARITLTYWFDGEEDMQVIPFDRPVPSRLFPGFSVTLAE